MIDFLKNNAVVIAIIAVAVVLIVVLAIVLCKKLKGGKNANENQSGGEEVVVEEAATEEEIKEAEEIEEEGDIIPEEAKIEEKSEEKIVKKVTNKVYHIGKRKSDGKWQVKAEKGQKAIKLFNTQLEAIEFAKKLALNQEARIIIHKEDGSFRKLTYKTKK